MFSISKLVKKRPIYGWILFLLTVLVTFFIGLFVSSIMERRVESKARFQLNTEIGEWESDPEKWKSNFPHEYEGWSQTINSDFKSKYGGSAVRDLLEEHPEMVVLWSGYAFSREYNQARGHQNAVQDVRDILRTGVAQPATCWTCKSPDVPVMMNKMGIGEFYKSTWKDMAKNINHSIGCLDCHNPKTMDLRISRPALVEAFSRQNIDINKSSRQEMRSLVCAQCHVEYYFKDKKTNYLIFPWDKGTTVEKILEYYDEVNFTDWTHSVSKTPMLKAQHPDYELWKTGVHADRGVSCVDCHMPYKSVGGVKVTDHKIQSPLNNVNNSCQVCHGVETEKLIKNVYDRQDKIKELRSKVEKILVHAHYEAKTAWDKGATEDEMKPALQLIRHAQYRWDFAVASIGGGFHAPLESSRILATAVDEGQNARLIIQKVLAKHGYLEDVPYPDISTKEKAQKLIGLDMEQIRKQKEEQRKEMFSKQ